jgi:CHAD domain-containing protein
VRATTHKRHGQTPATELVFVVPGEVSGEAIARSLQALLPTRHHPIATRRFTVLDTFDGRVRRTGSYLTHDGENGISTVAWRSHGGGIQLAMRLKQPASFAWDFPDGPLQQRLASVIGQRRLLPQADAEEHGSLLEILDNRGKTVARLRIASGQARLPISTAAWQSLPTLITLTGLRGYEDAYKRLVPVIESRPGLEPCPEGPFGVMLGRIGVSMRDGASLPQVDLAPTVRADIGARQIHLALLDILEANEPGLRANLDSEFLHDFRVAVRRTRSLLGQIRRVFPQDSVERFSTEFSWLGRLTGPPRDMDVLMLAVRQHAAELSVADCEALLAALGQAQRQEHDRLIQALDSDRYHTLLSDWKSFLSGPVSLKPAAENASASLATVVSRRAWRLSRRIASSGETIDDRTAPERIHAVRVDAKKLRYLVDVTPAFYDSTALACVLTALKKLQRVLGDFNDADVQQRRLLECASALGAGTPATILMTLGRLAEQCQQRREGLRREALEKLATFRARDMRLACRRAFKMAGSAERTR